MDRERRRLIVNADDFGLSEGVNRGILEAYGRGIVTSTSLMVRGRAVQSAVNEIRRWPNLSVGLHVDLGEWAYSAGTWEAVYEVVAQHDARAVSDEVDRQLNVFRRLMGQDPTHLDSHQHVHLREPARAVLIELSARLGIPLRHCGSITYCGSFYGQTTDGTMLPGNIASDALIRILASLGPGTTELACHPGYADDLETMYAAERRAEVAVLCDPRVRTAINDMGIELYSFAGIAEMAHEARR